MSTAWNQGCRHAKLLMHAQALPFMSAALDLMDTSEVFKENREVSMPIGTQCMPHLGFDAHASTSRGHVHE